MKMLPVLLITCTLHAQPTRPVQIGDLFRMKRVASPALSPGGRTVVFAVTTPDLAGNKSATDLWLSTVDGKSIRQLTTHSTADRNPAWSPDGMWIAFESTRSGENQIWLISTSGGEPRQFTTLSTGASQAVWSPDGKRLAFVSEVFPEFSARPFAESDPNNAKRLKELSDGRFKAEIFTRLLYRHWDHYVQGKRRHLFIQALDGGEPSDLTPGDRDAVPTSSTFSGGTDYAFSPDGTEIAYTATPVPMHEEAWSTNHDIYTIAPQRTGPVFRR
jgi:Tol biopolymer transport system component